MLQQVETITFPCEEWLVLRKPEGEIASIRPIKGTWTLLSGEDRRRMAEQGLFVKGLIACPRCNQTTFLPATFDPPIDVRDGKPPCEYQCRKCKLVCRIILLKWDYRKLYCACYETREGDSIKTHKEYLHAANEPEARKFFWAQHGSEVTNLVGIALAVGFFATDKKAQKLIV
jgi:hypothetical protein